MARPVLLDLFCGAGGAAVGYHRAGFDVVGVDIAPQPHYPYDFHQADALGFPTDGFDAIHASPPCQPFSTLKALQWKRQRHLDLYDVTRSRLQASGLPWVIENVTQAPSRSGVVLCGSMFGLAVRRHRTFETSWLVLVPPHRHPKGEPAVIGVYGHGGGRPGNRMPGIQGNRAQSREAMGIEWMSHAELVQAVPPAYTEWVGERLLEHMAWAA